MQIKRNANGNEMADPREEFARDRMEAPADYGTEPVERPSRIREADRQGREPARAAAESVIDAHSTFDGHFQTEQDLRILGTASGEITCRGNLTIEEHATVKARIDASDAVVHGRVEGDIVCAGRLHLASTAVTTGTMKASVLVVEEGARVSGQVETSAGRGAPAAATEPAKDEDETKPAEPARANERSSRGGRGRELPSFSLVSSDDKVALDRR